MATCQDTVITYQQHNFAWTSGKMMWNTDLREGLDFGTDDVDASLVRCVEFHHTGLEQFRPALRGKAQQFSRVPGAREVRAEKVARVPIEFVADGKGGRGFSCAGRAVEEQMGQLQVCRVVSDLL